MCRLLYKLRGPNFPLNFPLLEEERRKLDGLALQELLQMFHPPQDQVRTQGRAGRGRGRRGGGAWRGGVQLLSAGSVARYPPTMECVLCGVVWCVGPHTLS